MNSGVNTGRYISKSPGLSGRHPAVAPGQGVREGAVDELELRPILPQAHPRSYQLLLLCSTADRSQVWLQCLCVHGPGPSPRKLITNHPRAWLQCLRVGEPGPGLDVCGLYLERQHLAELDPTPSVLDY
ncbi:hypothetical protein AAFF_G00089870 [Aldrovandia affinis]|uniref:Uncharacterized protein n=1 Tax=Aldrovandia affinis TaxID=143900 RepID=A0AAD7RW52_9TELE|nr:hypothetical protein AAFF_G00089870 [Aldrovandia affinis]